MESAFASPASVTTVTLGLTGQIEAAIVTLPATHRLAPQEREVVQSKEETFERLQNWTFTKEFALDIESVGQNWAVY